MNEINDLKDKLQIVVLTPDDLKLIIEKTAEVTSEKMMILFENKLAGQKEYYEKLLDVREIAAELKSSACSVYRYWREGSLEYSYIKPNEKGSTRAQIERFRRNLKSRD